jgi:hypothetical protein
MAIMVPIIIIKQPNQSKLIYGNTMACITIKSRETFFWINVNSMEPSLGLMLLNETFNPMSSIPSGNP